MRQTDGEALGREKDRGAHLRRDSERETEIKEKIRDRRRERARWQDGRQKEPTGAWGCQQLATGMQAGKGQSKF